MTATMTVAAAARVLGENPADLRRAIRNEQVPVIREGRTVRIPTDWVTDPAGWRQRHLLAMTTDGNS